MFAFIMGWLTWKNAGFKPEEQPDQAWSAGRQIAFAASVSLLNPHAIMDTIGVIGTSSLSYADWSSRLAFTAGCLTNSWIWFFGLMSIGYILKSLKQAYTIQKIVNKVSAVIMWGCALLIVRNLIFV